MRGQADEGGDGQQVYPNSSFTSFTLISPPSLLVPYMGGVYSPADLPDSPR